MKAILVLVFALIICNISAQNEQIYFIGEKIKEEHCPFSISVHHFERKDINKDGVDDEFSISKPKCRGGGLYYSKYKIIKMLEGKFKLDTVNFFSLYCTEFGYREPLKDQYVILGLSKNHNNEWYQKYIEKVYFKNHQWILPYKGNYPMVNYNKENFQKLKRNQRIKINISDAHSETQYVPDYKAPHYLIKGNFAISKYGFVL